VQPNLPDKQQVMNALLTQASSVFIHLDPRRDKVVVPPQFRKHPMLVLEVGLNMRVPIPDLEVDDEGVGCTLSFGGRPFWCRLPWPAVFALVTSEQRGMVWPPDVPAEVADRYIPPSAAPKAKPAGPKLVAVDSAPKKGEAPKQEEPGMAPVRQIRPSRPPMSDTDGNAAGVLEPTEDPTEESPQEPQDGEGGKPKRKLPSYLRVVK
jgi:stringent starvation protein B